MFAYNKKLISHPQSDMFAEGTEYNQITFSAISFPRFATIVSERKSI